MASRRCVPTRLQAESFTFRQADFTTVARQALERCGAILTTPDSWGRVRLPPEAPPEARRGGGVITVRTAAILRAVVFSAGIASTLGLTFIIAYAGPAGPLPLLELSLVPLAVVFWILASSTPAGDGWTLASVAIWVTAGMIAWFGPTLFW